MVEGVACKCRDNPHLSEHQQRELLPNSLSRPVLSSMRSAQALRDARNGFAAMRRSSLDGTPYIPLFGEKFVNGCEDLDRRSSPAHDIATYGARGVRGRRGAPPMGRYVPRARDKDHPTRTAGDLVVRPGEARSRGPMPVATEAPRHTRNASRATMSESGTLPDLLRKILERADRSFRQGRSFVAATS